MANCITFGRILLGVALLFFPAFSPPFYALYLAAGLTDLIDGAVARKTNTVSEFGSELDTAADLVLVCVCMIKLLPVLALPAWLLLWIAAIALIKAGHIVSVWAARKRLAAVHTAPNRITGLLLFVLPLTVSAADVKYSAAVVCAAATAAALQEGHSIRAGRERNRADERSACAVLRGVWPDHRRMK